MHKLGLPEMVIIFTIVMIIFTMRRPRKPPKFPKHPIPSHEPLSLFLRIKRPRADSWHF
jgi:hypothetical protein